MHHIQPTTIIKPIRDLLEIIPEKPFKTPLDELPKSEIPQYIEELERSMYEAAKALEFEKAAILRDKIQELRKRLP